MTKTTTDAELAIPSIPHDGTENDVATPAPDKREAPKAKGTKPEKTKTKKTKTKTKTKKKKTKKAGRRRNKEPLARATAGCDYHDLECDALRIFDWAAAAPQVRAALKSGSMKLCDRHQEKLERYA